MMSSALDFMFASLQRLSFGSLKAYLVQSQTWVCVEPTQNQLVWPPILTRAWVPDGYSEVFSPDGKALLTSSVEGFARLFDVESGNCLVTFGRRPSEGCLAVWSSSSYKDVVRLVMLTAYEPAPVSFKINPRTPPINKRRGIIF